MAKRSRQTRRVAATSNTYRFFINAAALHGREVTVEDDDFAHQVSNVLRLRTGDRLLLLDNSGWQYVVELVAIEHGRVKGVVEHKELAHGEPRTKVTLYTALMRPERFEWALQKGTELGVSSFVPVICERSTIADANDLSERKIERWERIVREAAEQSCRGKLPRIASALFFPVACDQAAKRGAALLLWEGSDAIPFRQALRASSAEASAQTILGDIGRHPFSVALFSGPEGGFTSNEVETARNYGIIPVRLGPRILRAETAPLAATAALLYEMGDLE
jgi:16S rRNA (uracil1498-N3)-methyltransferase